MAAIRDQARSALNGFVPLPRAFYEPSADKVAARLLGHWLIRNGPAGPCGGPIVEVEAYLRNDPACHAARGLTKRNRVMFGPPGHAYVYFIYGNHYCVNAVCRPAGTGEAVLIRAIEPAFGEEQMWRRRPAKEIHQLSNGPGKLCEALAIDGELNGVDLCDLRSPLFIAHNPAIRLFRKDRGPRIIGVRIGITQAAELPLRFYFEGSSFVSRRIVKLTRGFADRNQTGRRGPPS